MIPEDPSDGKTTARGPEVVQGQAVWPSMSSFENNLK